MFEVVYQIRLLLYLLYLELLFYSILYFLWFNFVIVIVFAFETIWKHSNRLGSAFCEIKKLHHIRYWIFQKNSFLLFFFPDRSHETRNKTKNITILKSLLKSEETRQVRLPRIKTREIYHVETFYRLTSSAKNYENYRPILKF